MIEEMKQKFISDPNVQDAGGLALGASTATVGVSNTNGWINLLNSGIGIALTIVGLVIGVLTIVHYWHRIEREKIAKAKDQLELEQYRRQLRDMAQNAKKHK